MDAFLRDSLGGNSIPFQCNEVKFKAMLSGTAFPGSSPSHCDCHNSCSSFGDYSGIWGHRAMREPHRCLWSCATRPTCKTQKGAGKGGLVTPVQAEQAGQEVILGSKQLVRVVRGQQVGDGVIKGSLCKAAKWCSYCILHRGDETEPKQGWRGLLVSNS